MIIVIYNVAHGKITRTAPNSLVSTELRPSCLALLIFLSARPSRPKTLLTWT